MNNNIQFAKIDVRKQSRAKQTALVFLGALLLAVITFFSVLSVKAYFTSTDTKSGELTFGTIEVKLLNGESDYTASSFQTKYLTGLMPGSTINLNSVNVKNTGTHSAYVLLNLDVSIPSKDGNANKLLHYNKWYNVNGEEVNTTNMVINETKPTLLASGSSLTSNIQWTVPGDVVGNDYKNSTATVNLSVYGTQTNLKEAQAYVDPELYATYFICSNANEIAKGKNLVDWNKELEEIVVEAEGTIRNGRKVPMKAGTYTVSASSEDSIDLYVRTFENDAYGTKYTIFNVGGTSRQATITLSSDGYVLFWTSVSESKLHYWYNIKTQLEEGTTATAYEPYVVYRGSEITQDPLRKIVTGKNLFDKSDTPARSRYATIEEYQNGIKATANFLDHQNIYYNLGKYSNFVGKTITLSVDYQYPTNTKNISFHFVKTPGYNNGQDIWLANETIAYSHKGTTLSGKVILTTTIPGDDNYEYLGVRFYGVTTDCVLGDVTIFDNIQVEYGSSATAYEAYSAVEDTFDINTQTLTRNVVKYEISGQENWQENTYPVYGSRQFSVSRFVNMEAKLTDYYISHFYNTKLINGSIIGDMFNIYPAYNDYDTVDEFKTWLQEQYANGTPVTVWYVSSATEEDKQETILTSKNLYNGPQRLISNHGGTSTTTSSAKISIIKGAQPSTSGEVIELGDDVFNMFYNNPMTVSSFIKRYEDDDRTSARLTIAYKASGTVKHSVSTIKNEIPTDEQWYYQFISSQPISSFSFASSIDEVVIWLNDHGSINYSHFEIKDIQIEVGVAPTSFERYDPTEYKRVNGVVLRQVGDVKDTYNASTKKITRNNGELILTGNENWTTIGAVNGVYRYNLNFSGLKPGWFNGVCSHFKMSSEDNNFANINEVCFTTHPSSSEFGFFVNFGNKESWVNYLKTENSKGNPVTLWYVLKTSKTEQLA